MIKNNELNISSKFDAKGDYYHQGTLILFDRIYCGVSGNTAVMIGEERYHSARNFYAIADVVTRTFTDLLDILQSLRTVEVTDYFWSPDASHKEILARHHANAFDNRTKQVFLTEMPINGNTLLPGVEVVMGLLSPKRLHFFTESRIPAALQSVLSDYKKLKPDDAPMVAALSYAVSSLVDIPLDTDNTVFITTKMY